MADIENAKMEPKDLGVLLAEQGGSAIVEYLKSLPMAVVGKQTCSYSLEAQATLATAAANLGGAEVVTTYWVDSLSNGSAIHAALKQQLKQATVPYVFINGEFIGGCDSVKDLQAAGTLAPKIYAAAAAHGLSYQRTATLNGLGSAPTNITVKGGHTSSAPPSEESLNHGTHKAPIVPDKNYIDQNYKPAAAEGAPPAYPPLFYFPEVVDSNVVRLTAFQVVAICIVGIICRKHTWSHYMVLGLAVDNVLRLIFGPGPSPLGQLARCGAAFLQPRFRPGIPKQFAIACGTFMSVISTIFLFASGFDPEEIIPSIFLAVYAFLAFLEGSIDFCMGCVIFGWLIQFGILPREIYHMGITCKPEMEYTYAEVTKWMDLPEPKPVRLSYPGKPPSAIDVKYKTKTNDHDRQSFNVFKHVKILHFNIALAMCGLAVLWRAASMPALGGAAGLHVSDTVGDALGIIATIVYCMFLILYAIKAFKYPKKIAKEWMCPLRSNAFCVPPACLVLLAFVCFGRFDNADSLAKVLFWIGAPLTLVNALYLGARWITDPHSQEHFNPAWLLPPTACFVCALVAPFLSSDYTEAAYLWYAFGVALSIPLFVITFQKSVVFNEPDDRLRPLKWTWVSAPAMAMAAQVVLASDTLNVKAVSSPMFAFDFTARVLYFIALSLGLMLTLLFLTGYSSRVKFDVTSSWAIAFPLEALAVATCMYAGAVPGDLPRGMTYAGLAIASGVVLVLTLHSIHALLMKGFFTMDPKYGPLSQQILTHEAFRAAGIRLKTAVAALDPINSGTANTAALADFALQFRKYRLAHAWHAEQEESVIFKEFESYAPGLCARQHGEHAEHEEVMARWGDAIAALELSSDDVKSLEMLKSEIPAFVDEFEQHLVGEEEHLQRGGRKQMNLDLQKQMIKRIWDGTPVEVWSEFFPFVVQNLPMHQQRVKFVRCFAVWAVPERAQLIGRMIALGVDSYIWERLVASVPEIAPRGTCGWKKYF